jgi:hypothetical protein
LQMDQKKINFSIEREGRKKERTIWTWIFH